MAVWVFYNDSSPGGKAALKDRKQRTCISHTSRNFLEDMLGRAYMGAEI
jgi:hypothetical protein